MMEINKKELRKMSRAFRTMANRTINAHFEELNSILRMFINYIDENRLISDYIDSINVGDFDVTKEVSEVTTSYGRAIFDTGSSVDEEIVFTYEILKYIVEQNISIRSFGMSYSSSRKFQDMTKGFGQRVVLPFANHIESYLMDIAVDMGFDEETKHMININGGQAQVNIANDSSTIKATQTNNVSREELDKIVTTIKLLLTDEISAEDKEIINDNVEIIQEELKKNNPKKGFLKTAWAGIEMSMDKIPKAVKLIESLGKLRVMVAPFIE